MKSFGPSRVLFLISGAFFCQSRPLLAGMPSITVTDAARLRIDAISFFVLLGFLSALGVKLIWNSFCKDFPNLPRLTYSKALGITVLWGLLFLIVLTMISGARELMTPGAWEKRGYTYKLAGEPDNSNSQPGETELRHRREARINALARALLAYAAVHEGKYPSQKDELPATAWIADDYGFAQFEYVPDLTMADKEKILVYEPAIFGDRRFILRANGEISDQDWRQEFSDSKGENHDE